MLLQPSTPLLLSGDAYWRSPGPLSVIDVNTVQSECAVVSKPAHFSCLASDDAYWPSPLLRALIDVPWLESGPIRVRGRLRGRGVRLHCVVVGSAEKAPESRRTFSNFLRPLKSEAEMEPRAELAVERVER